jgi:GNAT superfamily N-acetyltransferase
MYLEYRPAIPTDAPECIRIRGLTRENAISEQRLRTIGITTESWATEVSSGDLPGFVCTAGRQMVGYCFGASKTGEIVVLALLPPYEGQGVGRRLLSLVVAQLRARGHNKLYLGCSSDPFVRSYGFYRYLGWQSTGAVDSHGDELLELVFP